MHTTNNDKPIKQTNSSQIQHGAVKVYDTLDKIPGISNIANLLIILQKFFIEASAEEGEELAPIGSYVRCIQDRDIWECLLLALPIPFFGNIFIAVCRSESAKQKTVDPTNTPVEPTISPKEATGLSAMKNRGNSCYISSSVWALMHSAPEILARKREEHTAQLNGYQEGLNEYSNALNEYKQNNPLQPEPEIIVEDPSTNKNQPKPKETNEDTKDCWDCLLDAIMGPAKDELPKPKKKTEVNDNRENDFLAIEGNIRFKQMREHHQKIQAQIAFFNLYDRLLDPQGETVSATVVNNFRNAVRALQLSNYIAKESQKTILKRQKEELESNKNNLGEEFYNEELQRLDTEYQQWETNYDKENKKCFSESDQEDADEFSIILRQTILGLNPSLNVKTKSVNKFDEKNSQLSKNDFNEKIPFIFKKDVKLKLNNIGDKNLVSQTTYTNTFNIRTEIATLKQKLQSLPKKKEAIDNLNFDKNLSNNELRKLFQAASEKFTKENPQKKALKALVAFCDKILIQGRETIVFPENSPELLELEKQLEIYCQKNYPGTFKNPNNRINNINKGVQDLLTELGLIQLNNRDDCQLIFNKPITSKATLEEAISKSDIVSMRPTGSEEDKNVKSQSYIATSTYHPEKDAPMLNFQIVRFNEQMQKIKTPVAIPDYIHIVNNEGQKVRYTLASIVVHGGNSTKSGHYYSYLFKDDKVYKYDDMGGVKAISKTDASRDYEVNGYLVYYKLDTSGEVIEEKEEEKVEEKEIIDLNKNPPGNDVEIIIDEDDFIIEN